MRTGVSRKKPAPAMALPAWVLGQWDECKIDSKMHVPEKKEMPSKRLGEKPAVSVSSTLGIEARKGRALIAVFSLRSDVSWLGKGDGNGQETYKPCWEEPFLFARSKMRLELSGTWKVISRCVLSMRGYLDVQ